MAGLMETVERDFRRGVAQELVAAEEAPGERHFFQLTAATSAAGVRSCLTNASRHRPTIGKRSFESTIGW